jgi:carbohydrate esterase-like sialic acid-specific acetylesterase
MAGMKPALLLFVFASLLPAELRITSGATDDQVFQRDSSNRAGIALAGTADANGQPVEARVLRKHDVVAGFDWTAIGSVAGGKWSGVVKGLPAGGPYRIEVRAGGSQASAANLLVGDLWLLAGQSNMEGVGDLVDVEMPHELVHNFDMADRWVVAEEPLHTLITAADRVHWPLGPDKQPRKLEGEELARRLAARKKGAGLGLPFAVEMVRRTGVPVGLLSCAHGGTSMTQWDPDLREKGGDSLYGSAYRRVMAAGGRIAGVLWYQGESDASPKAAPLFAGRFEKLVAAMRADFKNAALPFYFVQIGRFVNQTNPAEWNQVQEAQRLAAAKIPNTAMVAAVDLSLDDLIHVGTQDLKRLGKRMANLATQSARTPQPESASFSGGAVRVKFSGVTGKLRSAGRVSGFSIHGPDGVALPAIYKARVDPADGSAILLSITGQLPAGASLWYGAGKDPYCNVRDDADMGVPVFGPMTISQ